MKKIKKTVDSFVIRELNREWLSLVTAHGGTAASGPVAKFAKNVEDATTVSATLGSTPKADNALMGSGDIKLAAELNVAQLAGSIAALSSLVNVYSSAVYFKGNYNIVKNNSLNSLADLPPTSEAQKVDNEKKKNSAQLNLVENSGSLLTALNGIANGITTLISNIEVLAASTPAATTLSATTFGVGGGLTSVLEGLGALRALIAGQKKGKQKQALSQIEKGFKALPEYVETFVEKQKSQRAKVIESLATEIQPETEFEQEIAKYTKIAELFRRDLIPLITSSVELHSSRKQELYTNASLGSMSALGGVLLSFATFVGTGTAITTPVGWSVSGIGVAGAIVVEVGKKKLEKSRKQTVERMIRERQALSRYINKSEIFIHEKGSYEQRKIMRNGILKELSQREQAIVNTPEKIHERENHTWYRFNFPDASRKGRRKFLHLIQEDKSGKFTIRGRLEYINNYINTHRLAQVDGVEVFLGIHTALTDSKIGNIQVLGDDGAIALSDAIRKFLSTKGIPESAITSIDLENRNDNLNETVSVLLKSLKRGELSPI
ncbi:hypothetical protein H1P_730023 [Hyella patelloides LEGE 07179]|uniref:Uncharacterized protein n=1 Tax=Hyella patelloides LEGE 07179 TaxID=945734 RepID=A0A563W3M2_9CYAN|nr:hypothetical protein [Hyella patelloides]VEP18282.1 hypothetical protein H1P_730023 [Hyella patelloides LEGE 07179]